MNEARERDVLLRRIERLESRNKALEREAGENREALRLMELQRNLSAAIVSVDTIEEGLRICLDSLLDACRMDAGGIYLFDERTGVLHLRVHQGLSKGFVDQVSRYDPDSRNCEFIRRNIPTYTMRKDLDVPAGEVERLEGIKGIGVIPLVSENRVIGCINIASHSRKTIPAPARIATETMASLIGNVVAHVKAKASLQRSEAHLNSLLESASGFAVYRMAFDKDAPYNFRNIFISPSIEEILGYTAEEWRVGHYYENVHPDDREGVLEAHRRALETSKFEKTARFYNRKKKQWIWLQTIGLAVRNEQGDIVAANGLMIDVTEKKIAEDRLRKREKELEMKSQHLNDTNTALEILLEKRSKEKRDTEDKINVNIQQLVEPYLQKLRAAGLNEAQKTLADIIGENLKNITGAFPGERNFILTKLTPMEIQVANLIRQGKTSKEIGEILCVSHRTVGSHRTSLRNKLGLKNRKVNLRAYLLYNV
ncbi:MAG: PAS domain-containing protein [Desulfobacteraceae bacterium]|nr:PAS domain-containing protein [Desulfobacteraceae bacterium]